MKVGLNVRIDVTKIDKASLYKGAKGTYLDLTPFVDTDNKDKYDNNGFVSHSQPKEERKAGEKTQKLGNGKGYYTDSAAEQSIGTAPTFLTAGDLLEDARPF